MGWTVCGAIAVTSIAPIYSAWAQQDVWRTAMLVCFWLALSLRAWWAWRNSPEGILRWDGDAWHWEHFSGGLRSVHVHYDFQSLMWIRFVPERGRSVGLCLDSAHADMDNWLAVRRALVWCEETGGHGTESRSNGLKALS
jgi:hypothetical protein